MSYQPNRRGLLTIKLLPVIVVCGILAACGTTTPQLEASSPGKPAQAAQRSVEQGDYGSAAKFYALAAQQQSSADRRAMFHVKSSLAALQADRTDLAQQQLSATDPTQLGEVDHQRYQLARKLLKIASLPPQQQLKQLPPPTRQAAPEVAAYIWKARARLLFKQYKYIAGIHNLVQRSAWLKDKQAVIRNSQLIFKRALESVKLDRGSNNPAAKHTDTTTLGWLRLAEIKLHGAQSHEAMIKKLNRWERLFPEHPATLSVLPDVFDYQPTSTAQFQAGAGTRPGSGPILLALPLTGKLAQPAHAIRAGFEMAHNRADDAPPVIVIDATDMTAGDIVHRARRQRAAVIVGPLTKKKVSALAQLVPRMPVLALNQIHDTTAPPSFYRYALAPEDDARTAAEYAAAMGWHSVIVLTPVGAWGDRILDAFRRTLARHGGAVTAHASFDPNRFDHKLAVQAALKAFLHGMPVDGVFMAARPVHARLLRSQLRFYHAAKLPVIATSDAYAGHPEPRKDKDLNGVSFTAIPWVISTDPHIQAVRAQVLATGATATKRFPRLFAMGIDAWRLVHAWTNEGLAPGAVLHGATGLLEVTDNGRIRRHLAWARFVDGYARLVVPATLNIPDHPNQIQPTPPAPTTSVTDEPANTAPPVDQVVPPAPPAHSEHIQVPAQPPSAPKISPLIDLSTPTAESTSGHGVIHTNDFPPAKTGESDNGSLYPDNAGQTTPLLQ